jgi:hypothetical protein
MYMFVRECLYVCLRVCAFMYDSTIYRCTDSIYSSARHMYEFNPDAYPGIPTAYSYPVSPLNDYIFVTLVKFNKTANIVNLCEHVQFKFQRLQSSNLSILSCICGCL